MFFGTPLLMGTQKTLPNSVIWDPNLYWIVFFGSPLIMGTEKTLRYSVFWGPHFSSLNGVFWDPIFRLAAEPTAFQPPSHARSKPRSEQDGSASAPASSIGPANCHKLARSDSRKKTERTESPHTDLQSFLIVFVSLQNRRRPRTVGLHWFARS